MFVVNDTSPTTSLTVTSTTAPVTATITAAAAFTTTAQCNDCVAATVPIGVGVGVPLIIGIVGLCFLLAAEKKKRRSNASHAVQRGPITFDDQGGKGNPNIAQLSELQVHPHEMAGEMQRHEMPDHSNSMRRS